jgi:hypothetical protein
MGNNLFIFPPLREARSAWPHGQGIYITSGDSLIYYMHADWHHTGGTVLHTNRNEKLLTYYLYYKNASEHDLPLIHPPILAIIGCSS